MRTQLLGRIKAFDAAQRYAYSVNRIRRKKTVWLLTSDEGFAVGSQPDCASVLPVWPDRELAVELATEDWADTYPTVIALDDWLGTLSPARDVRPLGVCMLNLGSGKSVWVTVDPEVFAKHLQGSAQQRYSVPERDLEWERRIGAILRTVKPEWTRQ